MSTATPPLLTEAKACLRLAVPLAAAQLSEAAISFIDTMMMGWLGETTLAAGSLGNVTFVSLFLIATGLISSTGALGAIAHGQRNPRRLSQISSQGLWLTLAIALPIMLVLFNMAPLLQRFGQPPETIALAQSYLSAIAWGFPAAVGFTVLKNMASTLNQPRIIMQVMVLGISFNVLGNYVLMYGKWGFPELGLAGLGWASTAAFWLKFGIVGAWMRYHREFRAAQLFRWAGMQRSLLLELCKLGIPSAALFALETGLFTCVTYLMGTLGTTALAAHQVALQTAATTFMVPVGIAYATTARVGQYWGQTNPSGSRQAGFVGIGLGGLFMAMMGILFWLMPRAIIGIYLDLSDPANQAVVTMAIALLKIAALFQIMDGVQIIANGALRGIKDVRVPMLIGLGSYWAVGLGSGYGWGILGQQGARGLWFGLVWGLFVAAIALTGRFWWQTRTTLAHAQALPTDSHSRVP
ncbi:MAG: MATE family efflux transporter [Spirulina sp. SIO3F2]|nr:MATE family efflux transporter [Spirulina sp. SIO3F2]